MKVVVLEGPDGSGKSYLASNVKKLGYSTSHEGGAPANYGEFQEKSSAIFTKNNYVQDRSVIFSYMVYANAIGYIPVVHQQYIDNLVEHFAENKFLLVYCRPPLDTIIKNSKSLAVKNHKPKEQVDRVKENIVKIVDEYDRNVRRWAVLGASIIHFDYTKVGDSEILENIKEYFNR